MTGASHLKADAPCQDAHLCVAVQNGDGRNVLILAVADGAGSAKLGGEGAAIATKSIVAQAKAWLADDGSIRKLDQRRVSDWIDGVRECIASAAGEARLTMRDYASTLLFALVDEGASAFVQIGDGAIVTSEDPSLWDVQYWPQHGQYANQTFFVTDDEAHKNMKFAHGLQPVREIVVTTDGLERVLLDTIERRAHAPAFERMLQPLRNVASGGHNEGLSHALAAYLASPAVSTRTDDDVTLVIGARLGL